MWKCEITGVPEGLLAGKRVSFKDHIAVAGIPETFGAFAMEGFVPNYDATVVSRSLEAGATVVGKNVMNGLAGGFGAGGGVGDYGKPLNPHDHEYAPGISSSGSAVAVVSGEADISFGGDQGGSIRIPASWSGHVGLKPTFGLVSHFGIGFGSDQSIDYTGPMTMSVEDAARALDATAGYDGLDPRQSREVPETYDSLSGLDRGIGGLRIAVLTEGFEGATDAVSDSVRAAIDVLAGLGAVITEVSVPEHLLSFVPFGALNAEGSLAVREAGFFGAWAKTYYPEDTIDQVMRLTSQREFALNPQTLGNDLTAVLSRKFWNGRVYAHAQNVRPYYVGLYDKVLAEADAIVMPTTPVQAYKHEEFTDKLSALTHLLQISQIRSQNTRPFNYTGHPALSVPAEKRAGLPVGLQIVTGMFKDDLALQIGQAYTHAVPYADYTKVE
jgi:amidase